MNPYNIRNIRPVKLYDISRYPKAARTTAKLSADTQNLDILLFSRNIAVITAQPKGIAKANIFSNASGIKLKYIEINTKNMYAAVKIPHNNPLSNAFFILISLYLTLAIFFVWP